MILNFVALVYFTKLQSAVYFSSIHIHVIYAVGCDLYHDFLLIYFRVQFIEIVISINQTWSENCLSAKMLLYQSSAVLL